MADEVIVEDERADSEPVAEERRRPFRKRSIAKWIGIVLAGIVALIVAAVLLLNTPVGKRFVTDQIAQVAPASGLEIDIGRIDGDLYGAATLHDVTLSDPKGRFMTIPVVELDWRPLSWFTSGLDVRELIARRGTLYRLPELLPGDPDAPTLPNFDIRIDRFEFDQLTLAPGLVGDEARTVDLVAEADIRDGRVMAETRGGFRGQDRLYALIDAEPDGDTFDIALDYRAPAGGVLAGLAGVDEDYRAVISGDGTWSTWRGAALVQRDGERAAAFRITNRSGLYRIVGQASPTGFLTGLPADALGEQVSLALIGRLEDSTLDGQFAVGGRAVRASGEGVVDLANNLVDGLQVRAQLTDPRLFGPDLQLVNARADAVIDGDLRDLTIDHTVTLDRLQSGDTLLTDVTQSGTATYDGTRWTLPLDATVGRIRSGVELADARLVNGTLLGTLVLSGDTLLSDDLAIRFPGASANLNLRGDLASGTYALAGPVSASGLQLENIGRTDANAKIVFRIGSTVPWTLQANFAGRISDVTNDTLANLAGEPVRFSGGIVLGAERPLVFNETRIDASKLQLVLDGRVTEGGTTLAGRGRHVEYGPFTVEAQLTDAGPEAVLVFANPYPAAGLSDVRVAISPTPDGFAIDTSGGSTLGPFEGALGLYSPAGGPTRFDIESLRVAQTDISGSLTLGDAITGNLALTGGGLNGVVELAPRGGGQGFNVDLRARNANFGDQVSIASADIDASGLLVDGNSTITGNARAQGLRYGTIFIGRAAAQAELVNGSGRVDASLAGRRGANFSLDLAADVAPERIAVGARGRYAGRPITMPRRAVLLKDGEGWQLQRTQLNYADGTVVAEGSFGGGNTAVDVRLVDLPLSLADAAIGDLGLGGSISGVVQYSDPANGAPVSDIRVKIDDLSRTGLVLSSSPIDVALVSRLRADDLNARAIIREGGERRGRLQARISNMPQGLPIADKIARGDLFAQLRFSGPAASLWRLAAVDAFDITGPLRIAADVTGSIAAPRIRGSLAGDDLRLRSALSGTNLQGVRARGTFSGSQLRLTRFSGTAPNGGTVVGSGTVGLDQLFVTGPLIDLRMAARNAQLLNANGLDATITGPLRIKSDGRGGGVIAGRLLINRASWSLGTAADDISIPQIRTREINSPADRAAAAAPASPWRYLINANAPSRVDVDGMGLDSEWSADVRVRGSTEDLRIGGKAEVVRGSYSFAGTRFELERGRIDFDENAALDPRIDILAETDAQGLTVQATVTGNATQPEIGFQSNPALPEEEILARLLFGGSITDLSATDAIQLAAAAASLRGGGGVDPINKLRTAIGLDRLRIVSADPALNRQTGVALGKNIGQRFYVEIITDGRGYSATEAEFRVTSWLSLLASISTIGRESIVAEYSRDY